jgi:hypothetical protein
MVTVFFKRAVAVVGTIASWVYTILDLLFDWVGRSTADDDARQLLSEKLPAWADWLFSTPSWVPAVCAVALTAWLIWLSRGQVVPTANPAAEPPVAVLADKPRVPPASLSASVPLAPEPPPKVETAEERQAKHELGVFVAQRVLPACDAQAELQLAALHKLCGNISSIEKLAKLGLRKLSNMENYYKCREELGQVVRANGREISLDKLMELVAIMSRIYPGYCSYADWICLSANLDHKKAEELSSAYKTWLERNELLEKEYCRFRCDTRFPRLYSLDQDRRAGYAFVVG